MISSVPTFFRESINSLQTLIFSSLILLFHFPILVNSILFKLIFILLSMFKLLSFICYHDFYSSFDLLSSRSHPSAFAICNKAKGQGHSSNTSILCPPEGYLWCLVSQCWHARGFQFHSGWSAKSLPWKPQSMWPAARKKKFLNKPLQSLGHHTDAQKINYL